MELEGKQRNALGFWSAVSIIVGIVVGVGIHEMAPDIFGAAGSPGTAMAFWFFGGVLAFIGALCFAELAALIPRSGGDYHYLKESYGSWIGFLFGWMQLTVLKPAGIGMAIFIFAVYAGKLMGIEGPPPVIIPVLAAAVISFVNIIGVRFGMRTQVVLTLVKVLGFGGIIICGLVFGRNDISYTPPEGSETNFALAMIFIMYAYGGWNDTALVTSEIRHSQKNLPRALMFGVASITVIYLLVNLAYLKGVGFEAATQSNAIAADVLTIPLGPVGGKFMSLLIMISALGAANGMAFAGARVYTALGKDYKLFRALAARDKKTGAPRAALITEGSITVLLILLVGSEAGVDLITWIASSVGMGELDLSGRSGFRTLFDGTAAFFWAFFLLTGFSLLVLRVKMKSTPRPFRVPLFPTTPLIFCGSSAFMLYRAAIYAGELNWIGGIPLIIGVVMLFVARRIR